MRLPDANHPIAITASLRPIVVKAGGRVIANSTSALKLCEASYPAVFYIPREDADMSLFARSDHATYCPYKGDASYFSLPLLGERGTNAVWTYETPYDAVAAIKDHLAFYPDRVEIAEG